MGKTILFDSRFTLNGAGQDVKTLSNYVSDNSIGATLETSGLTLLGAISKIREFISTYVGQLSNNISIPRISGENSILSFNALTSAFKPYFWPVEFDTVYNMYPMGDTDTGGVSSYLVTDTEAKLVNQFYMFNGFDPIPGSRDLPDEDYVVSPYDVCGHAERDKITSTEVGRIFITIWPSKYINGDVITIPSNNRAMPYYLDIQYSKSDLTDQIYLYLAYITSGPSRPVMSFWRGYKITSVTSDDPYEEGGISGVGGGGGTFTDSDDTIPVPDPPATASAELSLCKMYSLTSNELREFSSYLWTSDWINNIIKAFNDPFQAVLGLHQVPIPVGGKRANIYIGNVKTGFTGNLIGQRWRQHNLGTVSVPRFFGSYLDSSPYTNISIYLPYVGTHPLDPDDCVGHTLGVVYNIDVMSGNCVAFVTRDDTVRYSFSGNCRQDLPLSGITMSGMVSTGITVAAGVAATLLSQGAMAPLAVGSAVSSSVNALKPEYQRSGNLGGCASFGAVPYPYLIIERPRQAIPARQNEYTGYPGYISGTLGELHGYTEVDKVHLNDIFATDRELEEIERLLKEGVIL